MVNPELYGLMIDPVEWIDVGTQVTRPNDPFDGLINDVRTNNIIVKWQSLASEYKTPVMAYYHAFDTESRKTIRVPIDTHSIEKGLIKVKINQSELMREYIRNGANTESELKDFVLNDGIRLADQVVTRTKVAKAELLATGKITIKENNLDLPVDYGVPADHLNLELDLSPDADVSGQLQDLVDKAADVGVTLNGFITARKNVTKMRKNTNLQKEIGGNLSAGALLSQATLRSYLEEEFGLTRIITNDLVYGADTTLGEDGRPVITTKRYYPDNKITFIATNPAGLVGSGLWGDPPETEIGDVYPVSASGVSPYVYITQKKGWDPAVIWTKASALFIPMLFDPNSLWVATILPAAAGRATTRKVG